ncbi:UPF0041-domain-containing protein [Microthyrium microscopicum]|uniref:Mitochondrial pyruvate carrier n=1 Tax=Microthyrium microscopicum TaxID=703497 RepID=A0A6A6UDU9_9PEZI|nr:UPF0041-domain-containing protein [Microthyrium microscopicum]
MSFRPGLRSFRAAFQNFRTANRQTVGRRWQTTAEAPPPPPPKENLNPLSWNSPVGPKTVHFWAPVMKWILVGVSIADFTRPADQLSLTQNGALTATGAIWTRWCLIIKPKNYLLASVNFFLFLANGYQVARIIQYDRSNKSTKAVTEVKDVAAEAKDAVKGALGTK